jgi:hypothetical protein
VKDKPDSLFFYTAICFWAEKIALMAEEKSPAQIFLCLFVTKAAQK